MKKALILSFAAVALGIMAGCAHAPAHNNMTGQWDYTYGKNDKTGGMTVHQTDYNLSGVATDAEGKFILGGTVSGSTVTMTGTSEDKSRNFTANLKFTDEKSFEGTYVNSKGESGDIRGSRK